MEHKSFQAETKDIDTDKLEVSHWISTSDKDRMGDVVDPEGLIVHGKPTVLFAHGTSPHIGSEPIGRPLWIKPSSFQGKKGILARTQFFDDQTGRRLFQKVIQGFINSFSIGFLPLKWDDLRDGGRLIKKFELLEYSLVACPANAEATTLSCKFLSENSLNKGNAICRVDIQVLKGFIKEKVHEKINSESEEFERRYLGKVK